LAVAAQSSPGVVVPGPAGARSELRPEERLRQINQEIERLQFEREEIIRQTPEDAIPDTGDVDRQILRLYQEADDLRKAIADQLEDAIAEFERTGVEVRIKDITRFRGVRDNYLSGIGIVVGLEGTGDSRSTAVGQTLLANAINRYGTTLDASSFNPKNIAVVSVNAKLPPFAAPGNKIDVTVSSMGDAKSLQGGFLLGPVPLKGPTDSTTVIAIAQGPVSIGGFLVERNGSSAQKNHQTVGRIPAGATVETSVSTQMLYNGDTLYLELDDADLTTAQRVADAINQQFPEMTAEPVDGGSIGIRIPYSLKPIQAMSMIEPVTLFADVPAKVVVNERTGAIAIGGHVKLGPAVVAHGSLRIVIDTLNDVSQPAPLSGGQTVGVSNSRVDVFEDPATTTVVPPNTTINDLGRILQTLQVSPQDIIAILQVLKEQGALKAKLEVQ
jgi:flagellar P-ring protein precursor FlgI